MNTKSTLYTIVVFSENHVGLLNQLSIIFTRRCLNIESICASACSTPGVHKIAITCHSNPEMMDKVIKQIEKRIDVIKAFFDLLNHLVHHFGIAMACDGNFVNSRC